MIFGESADSSSDKEASTMRKAIPFTLFLFTALLVGCAKKPVDVNVTLTEFAIDPSTDSVSVNTPLHFTITNSGTVVHEFVLEPASAHDEPMVNGDLVSEVEDIEPGEIATMDWTITEPGDYHLTCYEPGHFEAGMVTTITVTP
jgi:uncharacterized cupredoxin-like copper-binding protein